MQEHASEHVAPLSLTQKCLTQKRPSAFRPKRLTLPLTLKKAK